MARQEYIIHFLIDEDGVRKQDEFHTEAKTREEALGYFAGVISEVAGNPEVISCEMIEIPDDESDDAFFLRTGIIGGPGRMTAEEVEEYFRSLGIDL